MEHQAQAVLAETAIAPIRHGYQLQVLDKTYLALIGSMVAAAVDHHSALEHTQVVTAVVEQVQVQEQ
jgi:hypothetical protein